MLPFAGSSTTSAPSVPVLGLAPVGIGIGRSDSGQWPQAPSIAQAIE